jgi:hypothetical protein
VELEAARDLLLIAFLLHWLHRHGAVGKLCGENHHLQGAAAERTPLGRVFAASRCRPDAHRIKNRSEGRLRAGFPCPNHEAHGKRPTCYRPSETVRYQGRQAPVESRGDALCKCSLIGGGAREFGEGYSRPAQQRPIPAQAEDDGKLRTGRAIRRGQAMVELREEFLQGIGGHARRLGPRRTRRERDRRNRVCEHKPQGHCVKRVRLAAALPPG